MSITAEVAAWLKNYSPTAQPRLRLLCLPYAGAGASAYRSWAKALPSEVELYALQLPGREARRREAPYTQLEPLIEILARLVAGLPPLPLVLFGHSLGAIIGFELARSLRRQYGINPVHMFIAGQAAPQLPSSAQQIHLLPDGEFIQRLREYNGTPEEILQHTEILQMLLPALRADFAICENYAYYHDEPLDCPVSVFGSSDDSQVSQEDLLAWSSQTSQSMTFHLLKGDHFFVHQARESLLTIIVQILQAHLQESPGHRAQD
jgi:medium-chain acyl-[acyl-carrier-protein] hydrolase